MKAAFGLRARQILELLLNIFLFKPIQDKLDIAFKLTFSSYIE